MILEVDNYTTLEALADDIKDAVTRHPNDISRKDKPIKVELSRENYERVQNDLRAYGTAQGVRTEADYKYNTWQVADEYVAFIMKDGVISDK